MKRMLYRMALDNDEEGYTLPCAAKIRRYCARRDHEAIRAVYGRSFQDAPWPADWDAFEGFDAHGVFVAEDVENGQVIGYVLSFRRRDFGYISVLAVAPEYRRQGVGLALVKAAIGYLRGLGLRTVRVDAFVDAAPAVNLYRKVGFRVETTFEDPEEE